MYGARKLIPTILIQRRSIKWTYVDFDFTMIYIGSYSDLISSTIAPLSEGMLFQYFKSQ